MKSINRIYQGRVSKVEILKREKKANEPDAWMDLPDWEEALWCHHTLFQDAVNYYLVALLALANESNDRIFPIRRRLAELDSEGRPTEHHVWTRVRRRGVNRPGMRESVARYLGLGGEATPEECFREILSGNSADPELLDLALRELLAECGNAVQQKGRDMLSRFCDPNYSGGFPYSKTALAKRASMEELPRLLHSDEAAKNIETIQEKLDFSFFANTNPEKKPLIGDTAKKKLFEALDFISDNCPDIENIQSKLRNKIKNLNENISFPAYRGGSINKDALKRRFFAFLLFKYVDQSDETFLALRDSFSRPDEKKASSKKISKLKAQKFDKFGDDPIRLARGERNYVFPAFTSLKCWGAEVHDKLTWKEFDIEAFKQALTILHQIQEKGDERDGERVKLEYRLACMRGDETWKPSKEEEGEAPSILKGDPRIERLTSILDSDLAQEYELAEGQPLAYGLRPRTIRGFRELRVTWNKIAPEGTEQTDKISQKLADSLRSYQRENTYSVGSVRLFEELLKPENWVVWQNPLAHTLDSWRKAAGLPNAVEFSSDPIAILTDVREMEREIERLAEPIRFTPADPRYSRRQFYFSNVCKFTERGEYRHEPNSQSVTVPIAIEQGNIFEVRNVRIHYSAPRLLRDNLRRENDENLKVASFLQPMMEALRLPNEMPQDMSKHAVALMPEILSSGEKRILLNFPISLNTSVLIERVGQQRTWERQFASYDGKNMYLRWPALTNGIKTSTQGWWWENLNAFSCMSVDLGQRDAGAFAVLDVRANHDFGKKPAWEIGDTDGKTWKAAVSETGLLRLPGEDAKVFRDGELQVELYGERGRLAEQWEWEEALDVAKKLCPDLESQRFVGRTLKEFSFPEQNDGLLRCFRIAQSRLARMQSLSWRLLDDERANKTVTEMESEDLFKPLFDSLPTYKRPEVIAEAVHNQLLDLRKVLQSELVRLAHRILPLRDRNWEWAIRDDGSSCHVLRQMPRGTAKNSRKVIGQRGLSMERIEQLEELRRRAQALNRVLLQQPGIKPVLGRRTRGVELPDPCPEILDRLNRIKEQRINQTAHLILARALGLRLKSPEKDERERAAKDIHGEYEMFREPVGFIVLEDLSRYLSSQGRAPRENSRLMKWCHRAVLHKLIELCEPYGIPVIEATAAYSSRFCSRSGIAGFRAIELTPEYRSEWRWQQQLNRLERYQQGEIRLEKDRVRQLQHLKALFDVLDKVNEGRSGKKPRTLIAPLPGGPLFVPANGSVTQADINAAINIGLRAIAAPESHAIHVRIRSKSEDGRFVIRADTMREKARWNSTTPIIGLLNVKNSESLAASRNPNFFIDHGKVAKCDKAAIESLELPVASGRGIWGTLRKEEWRIVNNLNNERLQKWGFGRPLEETDIHPGGHALQIDVEADVPI